MQWQGLTGRKQQGLGKGSENGDPTNTNAKNCLQQPARILRTSMIRILLQDGIRTLDGLLKFLLLILPLKTTKKDSQHRQVMQKCLLSQQKITHGKYYHQINGPQAI